MQAAASPPPRATTDFSVIEGVLENVKPQWKGVRASDLAALGAKSQQQLQAERDVFERELAAVEEEADDPLDVYVRYVRWVQQSFPQGQNGRSQLINLLERAVRTFMDDERYRNDPRYLRLWILYAENVDEPRDLFLFLESRGIGQTLALFYEEFALSWESQGRLDQAETVYRNGQERNAKPKDRLSRHFAEFQQRASQHQSRQQVGGDSNPAQITRPGVFVRAEQPSSTRMQPQNTQQESYAMDRIRIYQDTSRLGAEKLNNPASQWRDPGTVKTRNKENHQQQSTQWKGAKLPQTSKPTVLPKIDIHRDEESEKPREQAHVHAKPVLQERKSQSASLVHDPLQNVRSQSVSASNVSRLAKSADKRSEIPGYDRAMLQEGATEWSFEEIRARHYPARQESAQSPVAACGSSTNRPPTPTMTIATKEAFADIMGMFSRPIISASESVESHENMLPPETSRDSSSSFDSDEDGLPQDTIEKTCTIIQQLPVQKLMFEKLEVFRDEDASVVPPPKSTRGERMDRKPLSAVFVRPEEKEESPAEESTVHASHPLGIGHVMDQHEDSPLSRLSPATEDLQDLGKSMSRKLAFHLRCEATPKQELPGQLSRDHHLPVTAEKSTALSKPPYQERPETLFRPSFGVHIMTPIAEVSAEYRRSVSRSTISEMSKGSGSSFGQPLNTVMEEESTTRDFLDHTFHSRFQIPDLGCSLMGSSLCTPDKRDRFDTETLGSKLANELTLTFKEDLTVSGLAPPAPAIQSELPPIQVIEWPNPEIIQSILEGVDLISVEGYHQDVQTCKDSRAAIRQALDKKRLYDLQLIHGRPLLVERILGTGGFADVYMASRAEEDEYDIGQDLALKVQCPASAWEFYISKQLECRLRDDQVTTLSIVNALEVHLYRDESYLLMEFVREKSLLHAINGLHENGGMDELLVMFLAVELLQTVRGIHRAGIIHGDIKPDNILLRLPVGGGNQPPWNGRYEPCGKNGWQACGVKLIDFGKSVDTMVFEEGVRFQCTWKGEGQVTGGGGDILEMRQREPWTFDLDYSGIAGVIYCMLFGKYMSTTAEKMWNMEHVVERWSWKRYWQVSTWKSLFQLLLCQDPTSRDPEFAVILGEMQLYLVNNCERNGKSLKSMLGHVAIL